MPLLGTWDKIEIEKNKSAKLIDTDIMIKNNQAGNLTGDVKEMVQKLK